jgi:CPA2 family monovalent cation:H+ antiporter-2
LVVIVAIVIVAKAAVALFIVLLLRYPLRTGLVVAAGLAQVGEFSFILAGLGEELQLLPESGNNLILGAALISISLNPFMFAAVGPVQRWLTPREHVFRRQRAIPVETLLDNTELNRHAVVIGLGNVGQSIVSVLSDQFDVVAAERDIRVAESFGDDVRVVVGDATSRYVLEHLGLSRCVVMILTIPDPFSTQLIIERAREIRPNLDIVARALNEEQAAILRAAGASETVMPEREAALEMIRHSLQRFGIEQRRALAIVQRLRRRDWTGGAGLD